MRLSILRYVVMVRAVREWQACAVAIVLPAMLGCVMSDAQHGGDVVGKSQVSVEDVPHLLLGARELGMDLVLTSFNLHKSARTGGPMAQYTALWRGSIDPERGLVRDDVHIRLAVCPDQAAVGSWVAQLRSESAAFPSDVSREDPYVWFVDMALAYGNARLIFARGNVVTSVSVQRESARSDTSGEDLLQLAGRLAKRVDAVLAGKPEPVPVLPFLGHRGTREGVTREEQGLEWAWAVKKLQESWGEQGTTLVFVDDNGLPRGIPAKRLGEKDYLVPLNFVTKLLDPTSKINPEFAGATFHGPPPTYANVTILGKKVHLDPDKALVTADDKAIQLDRPLQQDQGFMLVPLSSFAEKALGVKVEFSKHGDLPKITLKPGGALGN